MIKLAQREQKVTLLRGGLDQVTPTLSLPEGFANYSLNFECAITGGYGRVKGYERIDGRPAPSDGTFTIVQINGFTNTPAVGGSVKQATSLATGVVAALGTDYLILTKVTGTFDTTHDIMDTGLATLYGTAVAVTVTITSKQRAQYLNAVADIYRADITTVGSTNGFGPTLGVVEFQDVLYAFRTLAADTTKVGLWKSTTGGWSQITLPSEVSYTTSVGSGASSSTPPAEGATLTQGGVTATVRRVMQQTGDWRLGATATDDTGRLIITNVAGGNFAAGAATLTGGATVVLTGAQTAVTIASGGTTVAAGSFVVGKTYTILTVGTTDFTAIGATANTVGVTFIATGVGSGTGTGWYPTAKYEFAIGNFFGQAATMRVFGADGANRGFEFDGTYYCPVATGATGPTGDKPKFVAVHRDSLFFAIASSLLCSETGEPYKFATGLDIPCGDTISGLSVQPGSQQTGSLGVFCRSTIFMLYGVNTTTFTLVPFNVGAGAIDYSIQNAGNTFFFNNEGVSTIATTINFGNFLSSTLTARILPFINQERTKVADSTLMRQKNQYRVFFNDGYGLYITLSNGKPLGCMPVYFPHVVYCAWESELSTGASASFVGTTDGYVMQLEKGTSFDGNAIDAMFVLTWDAMKSPRVLKAFKQASIELRSDTYAAIQVSYTLGYGSPNIDMSIAYDLESSSQGFSLWDSGALWDEFYWDGSALLPTDVDLTGTGENIQMAIASSTDYIDSFTINSIVYNFIRRRMIR